MPAAPTGLIGGISNVILGRDPNMHFVAQLNAQADLSAEQSLPRGPERRAAVWNDLVKTAQATQPDVTKVLDGLKQQGVVSAYTSAPLGNTLFIDVKNGHHDDFVAAMNATGKIGLLVNDSSADGHMAPIPVNEAPVKRTPGDIDELPVAPLIKDAKSGDFIGWNVQKIGAEQAWAGGVTGQGVTVGVVDTGIDITNPAVRDAYRGAGGTHDYNWMDFVGGKPAPYDDGAHGTHTAGTVAGHEGGTDVGVAPGAKLIIAKGLGPHSGSDEQLLKSLNWMLAPTNLKGENPDPLRGADVISNSWGSDPSDPAGAWGGQLYQKPLEQLKAAGTVTVFAAGNSGPGAWTVGSPGNIDATITVAATDASDSVATFSSRGPVTDRQNHGHGKLNKPDLAAPGVEVPSSIPTTGLFGELSVAALLAKLMKSVPGAADMHPVEGTGGRYYTLDGTSMATPAVAGAVALLLSKYPTLNPDQVKQALMSSAKDIDAPGWDPNTGTGRIDVNAALAAAAAMVQPAPAAS